MPIDSFYKTGFQIKRITNVPDGAGSFTETLATVSTITGRMRPLNGYEVLANDKLGYKTSHRFYCAVAAILNTDKIYDSVNSKLYEIKFIKNPMEMNDHLEVDCEYLEDHQ